MTTQKITFTTKSINKENNGVDTNNVRILPLNFAADGNNIEIVRIYFIMHDEKQKQKLDILEEQKTYELSFDDKGIEVNKSEGGSNKNNKNFCCAAGPDDELRPNKPEEKHYVMVNEAKKEIRVLVFPEFQLNIAKQETTNGNDSEEQAEETTGNEPRSNEEEKTNNGNNEKNNDNGSKENDKQTPPPKPTPNQPTQEQINKNREDLKQSTAGSDKEKLAESIKKNEEMKDKGVSQSSEDKDAEEAARKKLAEDKEKYRTTICQTTKDRLETNDVKKDELSSEAKTKLEKLENGEITEPSQVDEAEKIIIKDTYEKATTKKLTNLEKKVNQAIKSKDEKEIKKLQQELTQLINNQNYQSKKSAFEALVKKLESSNTTNDNSGDIPWKIIVPVGLVAVVFLVGMFIYARKRKSHLR